MNASSREVQKMCSIAASIATMAFNKLFLYYVDKWGYQTFGDDWETKEVGSHGETDSSEILFKVYLKAVEQGAMFDARCFNIPKEEVTNLIYWRQLDAIRNSIQMVGQAYFSHKELQGKSCNDIQDMLFSKKRNQLGWLSGLSKTRKLCN